MNYDSRNWKLLTDTLISEKYRTVPTLGRVQLLTDAFALAWNNQLDYATTLGWVSLYIKLQRHKYLITLTISHHKQHYRISKQFKFNLILQLSLTFCNFQTCKLPPPGDRILTPQYWTQCVRKDRECSKKDTRIWSFPEIHEKIDY